MRKLVSILLIALILLNSMGYYAVFMGLEFENDREVAQRIDADSYEASQAITITFPVQIPYQADQQEFERVEGTFIHEGEYYRMVKQKYAEGVLTIICYRDTHAGQIQNALTDYVKKFSDKPQDNKSNSKLTYSFIKDFIAQSFSIGSKTTGWQIDLGTPSDCPQLISAFATSILHPPEIGNSLHDYVKEFNLHACRD